MDLFKAIAASIGWVTSSFAGISAILYACGYLISRAQLRSLGLSGFLERSPDYFLQEGANFFVALAIFPLRFLAELALTGIILLVAAVLLLPLEIYAFRRRERIRRFAKRRWEAVKGRIERRPFFWRTLLFVALLAFLLFHLASYLADFKPALEVRDLLYRQPAESDVARWILGGQSARLASHFFVLVWAAAQAGLTLALVWYVTRPMRGRPWLLAPFVFLFMLYVVFLPISYGALMRPTRFPLVVLTPASAVPAGVKANLFLLNRNEREFVLWDQRARRVLWLPSQAVQAAEVKEVRPIFGKPRR